MPTSTSTFSPDLANCRYPQLTPAEFAAAFDDVIGLLPSNADVLDAEGASGRLAALESMSRLLRPGGRLVLTSRTWELVRAGGSRLDIRD
jgi:hypothetical protein